jgi:multisubunit Na+/H+ antiporter MnhG subunit
LPYFVFSTLTAPASAARQALAARRRGGKMSRKPLKTNHRA